MSNSPSMLLPTTPLIILYTCNLLMLTIFLSKVYWACINTPPPCGDGGIITL